MADEVLQRHAPLMEFTRSSKAWGFHPKAGIKEYDEDEMVEHFNMRTGESNGVVFQGMEKKNYFKYSQDVLKNNGWNIEEMSNRNGKSNFPDTDGGKIWNSASSSTNVSIISEKADLDEGDSFCVWAVVRRTADGKKKLKIGENSVAGNEHKSTFTIEDKKIVDVSKHDKHEDAGYIELVNDFYIIYASWKVGKLTDVSKDSLGGINFSEASGIDVAHMQAENSLYPTSPICTDGSTKTRAKDKGKIKNTDSSAFSMHSSGTFVADITTTDTSGGRKYVLRLAESKGIYWVNSSFRIKLGEEGEGETGGRVYGERMKGAGTFNSNSYFSHVVGVGDYYKDDQSADAVDEFLENDLVIGKRWCGFIHLLRFIPKHLSKDEVRALAQLDYEGEDNDS